MTTQLPQLGTSTPNGYQPATGTGYARGTAISEGPNGQTQGPASPAPRPATPTGTAPGAGASIAAPDTSALGQDPAYLAYLRALGVQDTTHSAAIQGQIDSLNRNVALRLPQMQQDANAANRNLLGRMESRGILNSGETEMNLARQQMLQQRQQAGLQDQAAQRTADLINQLAEFRANQGVGASEQGLRAGQLVGTQEGNQQNANLVNTTSAALGI